MTGHHDATALVLVMGNAEARRLTEEVKADAAALWRKLHQLYEGKAHVALGYSSWGAYYEAEFGGSGRRGYQLLEAARVVDALEPVNHGSTGPTERVARELAPVLRDEPEQVREVWTEVVEAHGPEPTAAEVREVVVRRIDRPHDASAEPLSDRQRAIAGAEKKRIEKGILGPCQAFERALPDVKVELAARVATDDEVEGWRSCIDEAIAALHALRQRIP